MGPANPNRNNRQPTVSFDQDDRRPRPTVYLALSFPCAVFVIICVSILAYDWIAWLSFFWLAPYLPPSPPNQQLRNLLHFAYLCLRLVWMFLAPPTRGHRALWRGYEERKCIDIAWLTVAKNSSSQTGCICLCSLFSLALHCILWLLYYNVVAVSC